MASPMTFILIAAAVVENSLIPLVAAAVLEIAAAAVRGQEV